MRLRDVVDAGPWSITGYAGLVDIPYRTLQNYLRGEREPSASALRKMAVLSGLNINWLLTGEGERWRSDYLDKAVVDRLLVIFFPQIVEYCLGDRSRFQSDGARQHLFNYLTAENHLGLGDALKALMKQVDIDRIEDLAEWKDYFLDAAESPSDSDGEGIGAKLRTRRPKPRARPS